MKEEYRTSSKFHHYINIVEIRTPIATPTIQCRYDQRINDFDIAMGKFSIGLAQDLIVGRLIINIRVRITRSGCATYTDKKHHGTCDDILERKWGIGLYKESHILQYTTQDNERSALKPPKRRYRTDLLL